MARALTSLNRTELDALAGENGIEVTEDDTASTLIEKLNAKGVTEAPPSGDGDGAAPTPSASERDISGDAAGGTPGGASESQQPTRERTLPGTGTPELPELDATTALGVRPLPAVPRNPAAEYDDSAKG